MSLNASLNILNYFLVFKFKFLVKSLPNESSLYKRLSLLGLLELPDTHIVPMYIVYTMNIWYDSKLMYRLEYFKHCHRIHSWQTEIANNLSNSMPNGSMLRIVYFLSGKFSSKVNCFRIKNFWLVSRSIRNQTCLIVILIHLKNNKLNYDDSLNQIQWLLLMN